MRDKTGTSAFLISLDFELYWGVRDHLKLEDYQENLLGARQAVPEILHLFQKYQIHATWATVGFLFCRSKQELMASVPPELPKYRDATLAPYGSLEEVGESESEDPFHYGATLIENIKATPFQEIGTHTLAHYFCLEPEQSIAAFKADLTSALYLARREGVELRSIVFPRNQYDEGHIAAAAELGITSFRGTESSWIYRGRSHKEENSFRRTLRLLDAHFNITGQHTFRVSGDGDGMCNVPSSRFLRPYSRRLAALEPLRLRRITGALDHATKNDGCFHLWWHPHNFGRNLDQNMSFLERIITHFCELRDRDGMQSLNMAEAAARFGAERHAAMAR